MKNKIFNIKGVILLLTALIVVQLITGFILSPMISGLIINKINQTSGSKISIEKARLWPVTLSVSLANVKVFDPAGKEKMVQIKDASARLSIIALLSKRLGISALNINGAEIYLESKPDGSFNIEKIGAPSEEAKKPAPSILERFGKGKDWFGKVYEFIKKRRSKDIVQEEREARQVKKDIINLPRGKKVQFETIRNGYLLEINNVRLKNAVIHAIDVSGASADITDGYINIRNMAVDPKKGMRLDFIKIKGRLKQEKQGAGDFSIVYEKKFSKEKIMTYVRASTNNIDLPTIRFIYEDSLPVEVKKGILSLKSSTTVVNENITSKNDLRLERHELAPKSGFSSAGFIPMPILTQALNKVDPIELKFTITGTLQNPKLSDFQESLKKLVAPYIEGVAEDIQQEGVKKLEGLIKEKISGETEQNGAQQSDATEKTLDTLKSIFQQE